MGKQIYGFAGLRTYGGVLFWSTVHLGVWGSMCLGLANRISSACKQLQDIRTCRCADLCKPGQTDIRNCEHPHIQAYGDLGLWTSVGLVALERTVIVIGAGVAECSVLRYLCVFKRALDAVESLAHLLLVHVDADNTSEGA